MKSAGKSKVKPKPIKLKVSRTHRPDDMDIEEWQRSLRKQFAEQQKFRLVNTGDHPIFSEFQLTNPATVKTYKIAVRGNRPGDNYCSCPDYSINNLGTCKHIEFTLSRLMKKKGALKAFQAEYVPSYSEVYLSYGLKRQIKFKPGKDAPAKLISSAKKYFDSNGILRDNHILDFHSFMNEASDIGSHELRCYDDVMGYIAEHQDAEHRRNIISAQLKNGIDSALFKDIIRADLYPYQKEGALFAVKAGRCLIGDDMGLGKTIQALTAAELMAKLFNIQKVLIISPTSLKYQWKSEIEKFTDRTVEVLEGFSDLRKQLYHIDTFYKVLNYELVFRDIDLIREWSPDLIILDEAQRIKNWQTRTAKTVKQLESTFAIVLTGTPIENKIEELHSIMEFIDRHHFGPLYRFVHDHRLVDEAGKVIGYQDLQFVRNSLKDVMVRRKKAEVLKQLPGRIDKNFFLPMTMEQAIIHEEHYEVVVKLVAKWRRYNFLCEADQRRLQIALNFMRMSADNTYLVDKKTVHGPKIEELELLLREIVLEGKEKVVIFSQWLRMTELAEAVLKRNNIGYVHLNGSIPSKQRKGLMSSFREDPACMVFLSTDAGGVGLNLQSGSVVINMDIPWNPAVLEQRIGRVHRLGQQKTVNVINFISSGSIEEKILDLLKFKKSLFAGALDSDGENVVMIGESQLKKFMRSVEAVADTIEKPDLEREARKQQEAELDKKAAEAEQEEERAATGEKGPSSVSAMPGSIDMLGNMLMTGAAFLTGISKAITQQQGPGSMPMDSLISRDEKTGKSYLQIPLPEPETLNRIFSAFGEMLSQFTTEKRT